MVKKPCPHFFWDTLYIYSLQNMSTSNHYLILWDNSNKEHWSSFYQDRYQFYFHKFDKAYLVIGKFKFHNFVLHFYQILTTLYRFYRPLFGTCSPRSLSCWSSLSPSSRWSPMMQGWCLCKWYQIRNATHSALARAPSSALRSPRGHCTTVLLCTVYTPATVHCTGCSPQTLGCLPGILSEPRLSFILPRLPINQGAGPIQTPQYTESWAQGTSLKAFLSHVVIW